MSPSLTGRRVLVTGAAGRIGSVTTRQLTDHGALVTALSIVDDPSLKADRVVIGDARSEADVAAALEDVELVVHLAALPHPSSGTPYDVYTTNVVSTFNVLAQAGARGIRRAVVASSINAYGVPMNPHDVLPAYYPLDEKSLAADLGVLVARNSRVFATAQWRPPGPANPGVRSDPSGVRNAVRMALPQSPSISVPTIPHVQ